MRRVVSVQSGTILCLIVEPVQLATILNPKIPVTALSAAQTDITASIMRLLCKQRVVFVCVFVRFSGMVLRVKTARSHTIRN